MSKRLLTVGRTDTPQAITQAFTATEQAVNSLADLAAANTPGQLSDLKSEVETLNSEMADVQQQLTDRKGAKLSPGGYISGTPYDGSQAETFRVDASAKAVPGIVARDAAGESIFKKLTAINSDKELMVLERTETAMANYRLLLLRRNGVTLGILGLDDHDRPCLFKADDPTTVFTYLDTDGTWFSTFLKSNSLHDIDGNQVVTHQQAAIASPTATTGSPAGTGGTGGTPSDPATLGDVDGAYGASNLLEARVADLEGTVATLLTVVGSVLGMARSHGLIAP